MKLVDLQARLHHLAIRTTLEAYLYTTVGNRALDELAHERVANRVCAVPHSPSLTLPHPIRQCNCTSASPTTSERGRERCRQRNRLRGSGSLRCIRPVPPHFGHGPTVTLLKVMLVEFDASIGEGKNAPQPSQTAGTLVIGSVVDTIPGVLTSLSPVATNDGMVHGIAMTREAFVGMTTANAREG